MINNYIVAQSTFQKTYGGNSYEAFFSGRQTLDDKYVFAGTTESYGQGLDDYYLVKTNGQGDTLWTRTYGTSGTEYFGNMIQAADSGFLICGYTNGFGGEKIYLVKTNSGGDTMWSKLYEGSVPQIGIKAMQTSDGGYILVGYAQPFIGGEDFLLIKTNSQGDTLWTRTYGTNVSAQGYVVRQTYDGGYIIGGAINYVPSGQFDFCVIKTNNNGDTLWTKTYGNGADDILQDIKQTADSGYIMSGYSNSFGLNYQAYIIRIDKSGDTLWTKVYGNDGNEAAISLVIANDGNYLFAGYSVPAGSSSSDVYLVKINTQGDTLWTRKYGSANQDYGYEIHQTSDGGYIVAAAGFGTGFNFDGYALKTDSMGNGGCNEIADTTFTGSTNTIVGSLSMYQNFSPVNAHDTVIFVKNGAILQTICSNITGINYAEVEKSLDLFPNPAFNTVTVRSKNELSQIIIYNSLGEIVFKTKTINMQEQIEVSKLLPGVYTIAVQGGHIKFIKE